MTRTDWRLKGQWIKNCNCDFDCPCEFNAPPTHGDCKGVAGMHIEEGYFGDVKLDGLNFLVTIDFPGPLHEGNGTMQLFVDERADEAQRDSLFEILSGRNSDEGTMFHIFSVIVSEILSPQFVPIEFDFDIASRRGRAVVPGLLETEVEPIRNPVTGAEHSIQVIMPHGFEHHGAEVACASVKGTAGIPLDITDGHSSLAHVEQTPSGVHRA